MTQHFGRLRPVYVVGIGLHPYQYLSETPYVTLGLQAVREALSDGGLAWEAVESAYVAKAMLPMAPGRPMLRHLGSRNLPITHIENASASGSSAFRQACMEVAAGYSDVSLAVGVDKPALVGGSERLTGIGDLANDAIVPFTHFALLAQEYLARSEASEEDFARVALKNHRNALANPYAQRRKHRSLDEIVSGTRVAGPFTSLHCTPVGEGAAAVLVASEEGIKRWSLDATRAVRVLASTALSQRLYDDAAAFDAELTRETCELALAHAGRTAGDVDVLELHDAFAVEELLYLEAMGISQSGCAAAELREGQFAIGGRCAVSASGGLIAMGHPVGPTGLGQIAEITRQLRGEAGERQHKAAKTGLAHMVGLGAVCVVSVLEK